MEKRGSAGGKVRATLSREEAVDRYYSSPNICLQCGSIIEIVGKQLVRDVRRKKFCNHSCSAKHSNTKRKIDKPKKIKFVLGKITKGELFSKRNSWQSARSTIRKNARDVYINNGKPLVCEWCGYSI
jgi:hypothetical protein